jgi:dienelactone hydrolase
MRLLLCLLLLALPAAARAAHFTDPWPSAEQAQNVTVRDVTFVSSDPFTPARIGHAPARLVHAELFLPAGARAPAGARPDHAIPAVVLLHGSAGNIAERGERYGYPLAAQGVAVLAIATYASRPDLGDTFIQRALNITETMFVADAYAGLRFLATQPEIDAHRVVLTGFSYGGMATEYALYRQLTDALAPNGPRFAGHVAFYAPCIARFADSRTTGAPLLMLYGINDELIHPARCAQVADDLRAGGSPVTVIAYPGAAHQWDGELPPMLIGRHLADCAFRVNRDGTVTDERTLLPMSGPFLRKIILGLCTGSRPYPIGRDDATVAQSDRDFAAFLARVFATPG